MMGPVDLCVMGPVDICFDLCVIGPVDICFDLCVMGPVDLCVMGPTEQAVSPWYLFIYMNTCRAP